MRKAIGSQPLVDTRGAANGSVLIALGGTLSRHVEAQLQIPVVPPDCPVPESEASAGSSGETTALASGPSSRRPLTCTECRSCSGRSTSVRRPDNTRLLPVVSSRTEPYPGAGETQRHVCTVEDLERLFIPVPIGIVKLELAAFIQPGPAVRFAAPRANNLRLIAVVEAPAAT